VVARDAGNPGKKIKKEKKTLVSLLFIYMIPIACKITDFSLYLFVSIFENIIILVG